jgi:phosphohistidine phosphatase
MQLFLIRHAIAQDPQEGLSDALRALTETGKSKFRQTAKGLKKMDIDIGTVMHSPWLRAVETAQVLEDVLRVDIQPADFLAMPPQLEVFSGLPVCESMAWVGHQPWMSEWASLLITGSTVYAPHFPFKKGGVWWLEGELAPSGMHVVASLPPKVLRVLA